MTRGDKGSPEKANKTFSPALITRAFPIVARNLCVKYARKHGLQRGSFNRTTTTALLRKHFIHVRQPPKFSLTGLFSRRVGTFSKSSFSWTLHIVLKSGENTDRRKQEYLFETAWRVSHFCLIILAYTTLRMVTNKPLDKVFAPTLLIYVSSSLSFLHLPASLHIVRVLSAEVRAKIKWRSLFLRSL